MIRFWMVWCFAFVFVAISCSKTGETIDVTQQMKIDYSGNLAGDMPKGQWTSTKFTQKELALFEAFDTINLTGATKPDSVNGLFFFPNPFSSQAQIRYSFSAEFYGQVEFEYVLVDNHLNIKDQGALSVQAHIDSTFQIHNSYSDFIHFSTAITEGQYRLYTTLSSQSSPHFYTCWINIEKKQ